MKVIKQFKQGFTNVKHFVQSVPYMNPGTTRETMSAIEVATASALAASLRTLYGVRGLTELVQDHSSEGAGSLGIQGSARDEFILSKDFETEDRLSVVLATQTPTTKYSNGGEIKEQLYQFTERQLFPIDVSEGFVCLSFDAGQLGFSYERKEFGILVPKIEPGEVSFVIMPFRGYPWFKHQETEKYTIEACEGLNTSPSATHTMKIEFDSGMKVELLGGKLVMGAVKASNTDVSVRTYSYKLLWQDIRFSKTSRASANPDLI